MSAKNLRTAVRFVDERSRDDLATYLGRAARIDDAGVRIQDVGGAVAFWVPVLRPAGLLSPSPLVIAVRAMPGGVQDAWGEDLHADAAGVARFDAVVALRGLLDRLARTDIEDARVLPVPPERPLEAWAGQHPPHAGWMRVGTLSIVELAAAADAGIAEVARLGAAGGSEAEQARAEVWTRPLQAGIPAGAAFAAQVLGFLPAASASASSASASSRPVDDATVWATASWWRLALPAGQVLVHRGGRAGVDERG